MGSTNHATLSLHRSRFLAALTATCSLTLGACIENEESIVVREDGSVRVTVQAEGDALDLANGYPVPLGGPWEPIGPETRSWLRRIGDGPVDDAMAIAAEAIRQERNDQSLELTLSAEFADAAEMPRSYAPTDDPYASAYLERGTRVEERAIGGRRVFRFERVYRGHDHARLDPFARLETTAEELVTSFRDDDAEHTEEQWQELAGRVGEVLAQVAELHVRDALVGLYTEGDASLPAAELPALYGRVRRAAAALPTVERLRAIHRLASDGEDEAAGKQLEELQRLLRHGIRGELADSLEAAGLAEPIRNALLYALEWGFTTQDAYGELLDETFRLTVELPGTLVGGNFERAEDGVAVWEFEGDALHGGDLLLHATSVLD